MNIRNNTTLFTAYLTFVLLVLVLMASTLTNANKSSLGAANVNSFHYLNESVEPVIGSFAEKKSSDV